jgi:hypothetical protein
MTIYNKIKGILYNDDYLINVINLKVLRDRLESIESNCRDLTLTEIHSLWVMYSYHVLGYDDGVLLYNDVNATNFINWIMEG